MRIKSQEAFISLNAVLQALNILLLLSGFSLYLMVENRTTLFNVQTVILFCILAIEIHVVLMLESRRAEPFSILLCLYLLTYYSARFPTLLYFEDSTVLARGYLSATDCTALSKALLFVNCTIPLWVLGFTLCQTRDRPRVHVETPMSSNDAKLVIFVGLSFTILLVLDFFQQFVLGLGRSELSGVGYGRIIDYLRNSLNDFVLLLALFSILHLAQRSPMHWGNKYTLLALAAAYVGLRTLWGSRSGFLIVLIVFVCVGLALFSRLFFKAKHVVLIAVLLPIGVVLFPLSSAFRNIRQAENQVVIDVRGYSVAALGEYSDAMFKSKQEQYAQTFQRLSYLDVLAEIMANEAAFRAQFNLISVIESIIDNLLTPGFNIWDEPRIAFQISNIYGGQMAAEFGGYQSDAVTIFGDLYLFFGGWVSLILVMPIAYGVKRAYFCIRGRDLFEMGLLRGCYLLWFIHYCLGSFGADWTVIEGAWLGGSAMIFVLIARKVLARNLSGPRVLIRTGN